MNHRFSSCHLWFARVPEQSPPRPQSPPETHPSPRSYHFPNAGHVFDSGPGFLGWFHNDEDSDRRSSHPYYPFLSKGEWEIAGFFMRSGLSMKLIDEFLSLGLVRLFSLFQLHGIANNVPDCRPWSFFPLCANPPGEGRTPPKWAAMEVYSGLAAWIRHQGPPRAILPGPNELHRIHHEEPPLFREDSIPASPRL